MVEDHVNPVLSRASSVALTTPVLARSFCSGPPRSMPSESPTMSTRRGFTIPSGCVMSGTVVVVLEVPVAGWLPVVEGSEP